MEHNSEDAQTPVINTNAASASTKEQVNKDIQLVRMFCLNLQPPNIWEDGFREFTNNISNYTLPSKNKFFEELIPKEFNRARSDLMETLESVHHMAITIHTWKWGATERSNMLTATAHFVHQSKLVSQTLFTVLEEDFIASAKANEFKRLRKLIVCIVVSGHIMDFNNIQVYSTIWTVFPNVLCMCCAADSLNLIFKTLTSCFNFRELEMKCQNESFFFYKKRNGTFSWHDDYIVLKYISENNNAGDFTEDERKAFRECFQMLKPFEDLNNKLSREQYLPASYVIPLCIGLHIRIKEFAPSTSQGKQLQKQFEEIVCTSTDWMRLTVYPRCYLRLHATFMDPRFKTIAFGKSSIDASWTRLQDYWTAGKDIKQDLAMKLNTRINSYNLRNPIPSTYNNQSEENMDVYLTRKNENMADATFSLASSVVSHYVHVPDLHPDEDPFQFWEDFHRISKCTPFYRLSHKYLCVPATAIPVESISGELPWNKFVRNNKDFEDRRSSLEYEHINEILFLHSYYSRIPEINN